MAQLVTGKTRYMQRESDWLRGAEAILSLLVLEKSCVIAPVFPRRKSPTTNEMLAQCTDQYRDGLGPGFISDNLLEELGFRLIKSTIQEQRRGRQRPDNFVPACRSLFPVAAIWNDRLGSTLHSLDALDIRRQVRFDPLPLRIVQPKQVPAHDPNPFQKRIRIVLSAQKN